MTALTAFPKALTLTYLPPCKDWACLRMCMYLPEPHGPQASYMFVFFIKLRNPILTFTSSMKYIGLESLLLSFFLPCLLFSCVSVYLRNWKQAESEAVFLHLPAYCEHLVLGREWPLEWEPLSPLLTLRGARAERWTGMPIWLHMYMCQSGWPVCSVYPEHSFFVLIKDALGIFKKNSHCSG